MPNKRKPPMIRLAQWNITIEYSTSELRDAKTKTYEDRVHVIVNAIAHTNIGKCLLKTLHDTRNPDAGVWIMPRASTEDYCNARTGNYYGYTNGKPTSYKGSRIQYSPERYDLDDCGWYPGMRPEEVLFHEAARAYRASNPKSQLPEAARRFKVQAEGAVHDKDYGAAAEFYGQAIGVAPWWPEGHFNRALVLSNTGDYELAIVEMKRYLELMPDAQDARAAQDKVYEWEPKVK